MWSPSHDSDWYGRVILGKRAERHNYPYLFVPYPGSTHCRWECWKNLFNRKNPIYSIFFEKNHYCFQPWLNVRFRLGLRNHQHERLDFTESVAGSLHVHWISGTFSRVPCMLHYAFHHTQSWHIGSSSSMAFISCRFMHTHLLVTSCWIANIQVICQTFSWLILENIVFF